MYLLSVGVLAALCMSASAARPSRMLTQQCSGVAASGGACGTQSGLCCPSGECCSQFGELTSICIPSSSLPGLSWLWQLLGSTDRLLNFVAEHPQPPSRSKPAPSDICISPLRRLLWCEGGSLWGRLSSRLRKLFRWQPHCQSTHLPTAPTNCSASPSAALREWRRCAAVSTAVGGDVPKPQQPRM